MKILKSFIIQSPIGKILTISSDEHLYMLKFFTEKDLEEKIEKLKFKLRSDITDGYSKIAELVEFQLGEYFAGRMKNFTIPTFEIGTNFEKQVWEKLKNIPYGTTSSYKEQAEVVGAPSAFRAVANANGKNNISLIIPCHRVIRSGGNIGGYSSGSEIKKWLLEHEKCLVN